MILGRCIFHLTFEIGILIIDVAMIQNDTRKKKSEAETFQGSSAYFISGELERPCVMADTVSGNSGSPESLGV